MKKKQITIAALCFSAVSIASPIGENNVKHSLETAKQENTPQVEERQGIIRDARPVNANMSEFIYTIEDSETGELFESFPTDIFKNVGDNALFHGQKIYSAITKVIQITGSNPGLPNVVNLIG